MGIKITLGILGVTAVACACVIWAYKRSRSSCPLQSIISGIREHASDFDGLYESLYLAEKDKKIFGTEAYREWCDRACQSTDLSFRTSFEKNFPRQLTENEAHCRKAYISLLNCITQAGITRIHDNEQIIVTDSSMCRHYIIVDGTKPIAGRSYRILKSAWVCGDRTVEYGMLIPI